MPLVRDLVSGLPARDAARPRLTWYGPDGERLDLSGRVLGTWVAKATNLLVEEADAGPGTCVLLDLPVHWRAVVWALAAWTAGGEVAAGAATAPDVVVTATPGPPSGRSPGTSLVVAVPLPALALRWAGDLPPGVLDGAADLMTQPDALGWLPAADVTAPALGPATHGELVASALAAHAASWPERPRVLVPGPERTLGEVLAAALAAFAADGSLVLLGPGAPGPASVASAERTTATA